MLRQRALLEVLFPAVERYLAKHPGGLVEQLLRQGLRNTDARVAHDKPVTPTFLFALLLYGPIAQAHRIAAAATLARDRRDRRGLRSRAARGLGARDDSAARGARACARCMRCSRGWSSRAASARCGCSSSRVSVPRSICWRCARSWAWHRPRSRPGGPGCRKCRRKSACSMVGRVAACPRRRPQRQAPRRRWRQRQASHPKRKRLQAGAAPIRQRAGPGAGADAGAGFRARLECCGIRPTSASAAIWIEPASQVRRALAALPRLPQTRLVLQSSLYGSKPLGPALQPDFVNAVAALLTQLEAAAFFGALRALETALGPRAAARALGPAAHRSGPAAVRRSSGSTAPNCTLPHPGIVQRNFVLYPLLEVAPELNVPGRGRVAELAARVDPAGIWRLDNNRNSAWRLKLCHTASS